MVVSGAPGRSHRTGSATATDAIVATLRANGGRITATRRATIDVLLASGHDLVLRASDGDCDQWWRSRPEAALTGVSYRHGGGWWSGPREPHGYTVAHAGHWVWAGTGVSDGDAGRRRRPAGGLRMRRAPLDQRRPGPRRPLAASGTPSEDRAVRGTGVLGRPA